MKQPPKQEQEHKETFSDNGEVELMNLGLPPPHSEQNGNDSSGSDTDATSDSGYQSESLQAEYDDKGWLKQIDYDDRKQVKFLLNLLKAYGKAFYGHDQTIHLSWKREIAISIGLDVTKINKLKPRLSNCKLGETVDLQDMKLMESNRKIRDMGDGPVPYALYSIKQYRDWIAERNNITKRLTKFLNRKGISYKIMLHFNK